MQSRKKQESYESGIPQTQKKKKNEDFSYVL